MISAAKRVAVAGSARTTVAAVLESTRFNPKVKRK
jgi:hypothetical protein